jgi:hypothetical protein
MASITTNWLRWVSTLQQRCLALCDDADAWGYDSLQSESLEELRVLFEE